VHPPATRGRGHPPTAGKRIQTKRWETELGARRAPHPGTVYNGVGFPWPIPVLTEEPEVPTVSPGLGAGLETLIKGPHLTPPGHAPASIFPRDQGKFRKGPGWRIFGFTRQGGGGAITWKRWPGGEKPRGGLASVEGRAKPFEGGGSPIRDFAYASRACVRPVQAFEGFPYTLFERDSMAYGGGVRALLWRHGRSAASVKRLGDTATGLVVAANANPAAGWGGTSLRQLLRECGMMNRFFSGGPWARPPGRPGHPSRQLPPWDTAPSRQRRSASCTRFPRLWFPRGCGCYPARRIRIAAPGPRTRGTSATRHGTCRAARKPAITRGAIPRVPSSPDGSRWPPEGRGHPWFFGPWPGATRGRDATQRRGPRAIRGGSRRFFFFMPPALGGTIPSEGFPRRKPFRPGPRMTSGRGHGTGGPGPDPCVIMPRAVRSATVRGPGPGIRDGSAHTWRTGGGWR